MHTKTRTFSPIRRKTLAAALLALPLALTGCLPQNVVLQPAGAATIAGVGFLGLAYVVTAADPSTGPRVTFHNDADVPVQVRYWIGRIDVTAPGGVSDIRTKRQYAIVVEPGEQIITRVGSRVGWTTSGSDMVVWARLDSGADVVLPPHEIEKLWEGSDQPQWFQISRPLPFVWQALGSADDLQATRLGEGDLSPLPQELWIDDNAGEHPVRHASQVAPKGDQDAG